MSAAGSAAGSGAGRAVTVPAVDGAALRRDLEDLVRIPSVTGDEDAIAANLADRLESLGLEVEVFHPDPAAIRDDPDWPGEEVPRSRLPVVLGRAGQPGGRRLRAVGSRGRGAARRSGESWTVDPWSAEVRDGRLFGRGACDMKGGVAAILGAVRALRDAGTLDALAGELVVALVPSEEDGGQGTLAAIRAGATGDLAIIAEPSGLDIVVAHAGAITFRLTVPGRAAHASRRTEGVSALANLQALVQALEADEADRNAAETDPLMTDIGLPYPTIDRHRRRRRVGLDRDGPDHRGRPLRGAPGPDARGRGRRASRVHRGGLCRRPVPARPPGDGRDHRRANSRPRPCPPTTAS